MTTPKNIIKRIRKIPRKAKYKQPAGEVFRVKMMAKQNKIRAFENDKAIVRNKNFSKAVATRKMNMAARMEKQDAIQNKRIMSLRKARRKLRRIRGA